ncbi:Sodium/calcium exchanger protein-domain-containing protein [Cryomyces antarcticus]
MGEPSDDSSVLDGTHSWAKHHALDRNSFVGDSNNTLPTTNPPVRINNVASLPSRSAAARHHSAGNSNSNSGSSATRNNDADDASTLPPPAPPPHKSQAEGATPPAIETTEKSNLSTRIRRGCFRFGLHTKEALCHSWINVLLVFVPAGIAVKAAGASPTIVFALNAVAIIPLAGMLSHATESVASRLGDTIGALMNVTFGNAVELIIFIIALVKNEIRIVQASLLGSILANLLLILGMAFLFGGLRFREQIYNSTVTQMSACLLSLSVMSLLLPTAFHASFADTGDADLKVLKISRGTSVVLLLVYVLYLLFQLKSHAYMYESTPQQIIDEESHPGVLADMLGSSSSSDTSSSSSGTDTDTSGSHTTTKRIKRAFRHRRRRKSSASSTNTPSIPSVLSSPVGERNGGFLDSHNVAGNGQSRGSALHAIMSGDEADTDGENDRRAAEPRIRDFEAEKGTTSKSPERKSRKKTKKGHKKHHSQDEKDIVMDEKASLHKAGKKPVTAGHPEPRVGFADEVRIGQDPPVSRSSFNLRQFSTRPAFRPALPKMLSNNVFVTPPPGALPAVVSTVVPLRSTPSGIRRTNSLPDRLNKAPNSPTVSSDPIPPYQRSLAPSENIATLKEHDQDAPVMSRTSAVFLLLISTGLVAVCAEFLVDAIPAMIDQSPVSQAFIGLIILPIVGNAAEHVTAVTVATKNKMDLAIGVAVGSSIQIALFVTPFVVLLGWILQRDMSLFFNLFETSSLFVTAFVVNFLVLDGRSNYLEGALLIAAYIIIAVAAFFYPDTGAQSVLGGSGGA